MRSNILLFAVVAVLFLTNYVPGTWLSGWDNLHPEFWPAGNISRGLNSVWQDNQSFGNAAGMAFATTFFHSVFAFLLTAIFSESLVRYLILYFLIYLGALGVFYLLCFLGFDEKKRIFAYVAAIFYVLNFAHVQIVGVPTESFVAFLGLLPWEILVFLKLLGAENRKEVLVSGMSLLLINLVGSFQFLTQTIFIVYLIVLGVFSFDHILRHRTKHAVKSIFFAFWLILLANSFWLLPQAYFLSTNIGVVSSSKINQIATKDVLSQSAGRSNFFDFTRFIGIYYDLYNAKGGQIFSVWKNHFSNPFVIGAQALIFAFVVLGIFKKFKYHLAFVFLFLISATALLSSTFPFSIVGSVINANPLLGQIFRSPFTKFATVYSLVAAYFLALGLEFTSVAIFRLSRFRDSLFRHVLVALVAALAIVFIAIPAFNGNYVSSLVKIKYPQAYFDLMKYFETEVNPTSQVALLPDISFWGWFKYNWGYEGSGFLWYGMPQAVISRTFDVWSFNSESFYWEVKYALESKNIELFEKVLEKYQVDYLIFDPSLLSSSTLGHGAALENLEGVLRGSERLNLSQQFDNIRVYEVKNTTRKMDDTSIFGTLPKVGPTYSVTDLDLAYTRIGTYTSSPSKAFQYYFPFINLMTQTQVPAKEWSLAEKVYTFEVSAPLAKGSGNLVLPSEDSLSTKIFLGDEVRDYRLRPEVSQEPGKVTISVPKELIYDFDLSLADVRNCGPSGSNVEGKFLSPDLQVASSETGIGCFGFEIPLLAHWTGYLVSLETENVEGSELFFYILGSKSERFSKAEALLGTGRHYFLLNPGNFFSDGYIFSFQNEAFGRGTAVNKLKHLRVYLFPVEYIRGIYAGGEAVETPAVSQTRFVSEKVNQFTYEVNTSTPGKTLVLWQSYDSGWVAFCGFKICDAEHIHINNWANGWVFNNQFLNEKITIVFWPQYLEYIGLLIAFSTFGWCIWALLREKTRKTNP